MLVLKIYNFIYGYLSLFIEGRYLERFLNLASNAGVYIWDIKRVSPSTMRARVSRRGFCKLRSPAFKTRTKVRIIKKHGLVTFLKHYAKRKMLVTGAVLFVIIQLVLSSFIWQVDVIGNNLVPSEKIMEKLSQYNLKKGAFRSKIDITRIQNAIINDLDAIAWVSIDLKGSRVCVSVKERKLPPPIIQKHIPCNITAKRDGTVLSFTAQNGETRIAIGQTVVKGQVLLSGSIPSRYEGMRYVHAMGSVIAKTWYEKSVVKKLYKYEKIPTGRTVHKRNLNIAGLNINLWIKEESPFANTDVTVDTYVLGFLQYTDKKLEELTYEKKSLTVEQAVSEAVHELDLQLHDETYDIEVVSKKSEYKQTDDETIEVRLLIEAIEDIALQEEIQM